MTFCKIEEVIPFDCHYLLLFYYLFTLFRTLFMHRENAFLYNIKASMPTPRMI